MKDSKLGSWVICPSAISCDFCTVQVDVFVQEVVSEQVRMVKQRMSKHKACHFSTNLGTKKCTFW